ncbi:MAG: rRNA maturation RNase YbeY [Armatimonadota bacterium]
MARRLLQAEDCSANTEVSILLTDDKQIAELNKQYRGIEDPTDVLSFSLIEGDDEFPPDEEGGLLGDVVISIETAQKQAEAQGHDLDHEIDVLLVHGLLHLLGYDHAEPEDEKEMFGRQAEILKIIAGDE